RFRIEGGFGRRGERAAAGVAVVRALLLTVLTLQIELVLGVDLPRQPQALIAVLLVVLRLVRKVGRVGRRRRRQVDVPIGDRLLGVLLPDRSVEPEPVLAERAAE